MFIKTMIKMKLSFQVAVVRDAALALIPRKHQNQEI